MSVTRVKVSDHSVPSWLSALYSITRTGMPGMSRGSAPLRRRRREAAGSAIPRQVGAVWQDLQDRQAHVALRAPQHVHAGSQDIFEQVVGQEVAVGGQQVTR